MFYKQRSSRTVFCMNLWKVGTLFDTYKIYFKIFISNEIRSVVFDNMGLASLLINQDDRVKAIEDMVSRSKALPKKVQTQNAEKFSDKEQKS